MLCSMQRKNVWTISIIAVVNQYCSLSQQLTVSLERHIDGGVEARDGLGTRTLRPSCPEER